MGGLSTSLGFLQETSTPKEEEGVYTIPGNSRNGGTSGMRSKHHCGNAASKPYPPTGGAKHSKGADGLNDKVGSLELPRISSTICDGAIVSQVLNTHHFPLFRPRTSSLLTPDWRLLVLFLNLTEDVNPAPTPCSPQDLIFISPSFSTPLCCVDTGSTAG